TQDRVVWRTPLIGHLTAAVGNRERGVDVRVTGPDLLVTRRAPEGLVWPLKSVLSEDHVWRLGWNRGVARRWSGRWCRRLVGRVCGGAGRGTGRRRGFRLCAGCRRGPGWGAGRRVRGLGMRMASCLRKEDGDADRRCGGRHRRGQCRALVLQT